MSSGREIEEVVTCTSCEYRYLRSHEACPMCGLIAPQPVPEPGPELEPELEAAMAASEASEERVEWRPVGEANLPTLSYDTIEPPGRSLVPFLLVLGIVVAAFLFWRFHRGQTREAAPPEAAVASAPVEAPPPVPVEPPAPSAEDPPPMTPPPAPPASVPAAPVAAPVTAPSTPSPVEKATDPSELWKQVARGNTQAEVALAQLYLEGSTVPQSCAQAQMLLLAASKKRNKQAEKMLSGAYAHRCQ